MNVRGLRALVAGLGLGGMVIASGPGCAKPVVAKDGTVVFQEPGTKGAGVLTANGIEYHDGTDLPTPVIVRDANQPFRAPVGFILPANGRFTKTSRPTVMAAPGLKVTLRPSDTRVPAWGGEVLVRVDVAAAAAENREPLTLALVLDGYGADSSALALAVLAQLGGDDSLTIVDARGGKIIVPKMPATDRSLAVAAMDRRVARNAPGAPDLATALKLAAAQVGDKGIRHIVVLSEVGDRGLPPAAAQAVEQLAGAGIVAHAFATGPGVDLGRLDAIASPTGGVASNDGPLAVRTGWAESAVPAPGPLAFKDVVVTFEGTPAPSHVIEASGGEVYWRLDAGELALGDVRQGEGRTDVVRVSVPPWTTGEPFTFRVTARASDAKGTPHVFRAEVPMLYDDNFGRIAESRHGDVIAYASALATLRRLHTAFAGQAVARAGGLRRVATLHATSMALLGRDTKDGAVLRQAAMLKALLEATDAD